MTESDANWSANQAADMHVRLAGIARALAEPSSVAGTIERVAKLAAGFIDQCEGASVSVCSGAFHGQAWSAKRFGKSSRLQSDLGQGPFHDLSNEDPIVMSNDLSTENRWTQWCAQVSEQFGVQSVMGVRLFTNASDSGAMTFYSLERQAFPAPLQTGVLAFAAFASAAVQAARTQQRLDSDLKSQTIIGQAQGVIMERFHVDALEAYGMLDRVSYQANIRIQDLADETISAKEHPDVAQRNPRLND